jgi:hypothetical protein
LWWDQKVLSAEIFIYNYCHLNLNIWRPYFQFLRVPESVCQFVWLCWRISCYYKHCTVISCKLLSIINIHSSRMNAY